MSYVYGSLEILAYYIKLANLTLTCESFFNFFILEHFYAKSLNDVCSVHTIRRQPVYIFSYLGGMIKISYKGLIIANYLKSTATKCALI